MADERLHADPQPVMRIFWWLLPLTFIASVVIALGARSPGWTGTLAENGKYYVIMRSQRFETSFEEYENTRRRYRVSMTAAFTGAMSMLGFVTLESVRFRQRRRRSAR